VKESNEVVMYFVKTGSNFVLSITHQSSFASLNRALLKVGSSKNLNKRYNFLVYLPKEE
jgi:hypothetical protein